MLMSLLATTILGLGSLEQIPFCLVAYMKTEFGGNIMSSSEDQDFCAIRMRTTTELAPAANGVASWVTVTKYDVQLVSVVVGFLPDPAIFGLDNYTFLVVDPNTGTTFVRQPMTMVPSGEGAWGGTYTQSLGNGSVPLGPVMVFASNLDGLLGIQVAAGSFAACTIGGAQ